MRSLITQLLSCRSCHKCKQLKVSIDQKSYLRQVENRISHVFEFVLKKKVKSYDQCLFLELVFLLLGLLWQLVQVGEAVSALMNSSGGLIMCDENQDILANNSQTLIQNQEHPPTDHCPLPLLLKKVSV